MIFVEMLQSAIILRLLTLGPLIMLPHSNCKSDSTNQNPPTIQTTISNSSGLEFVNYTSELEHVEEIADIVRVHHSVRNVLLPTLLAHLVPAFVIALLESLP